MMDRRLLPLFCFGLLNTCTDFVFSQQQSDLNYIGSHLDVSLTIADNLEFNGGKHTFEVLFTNKGNSPISGGNWSIYFYSFFMIESDHLPSADEYILPHYNMKVRHVQGCLFTIQPTVDFVPIEPGASRYVEFYGQNWAVSKTDVPPNWYVAAEGLDPALIQSTETHAPFITDMDSVRQWKRYRTDRYNPYTPQDRYRRFYVANMNTHLNRIIPQPKTVQNLDESMMLNIEGWSIESNKSIEKEANYLGGKLNMTVNVQDNVDESLTKKILMMVIPEQSQNPDYYLLEVIPAQEKIILIGQSASGVFYGIQSLLSLVSTGLKTVPSVLIIDEPRFQFRGMHVDMARNFNGKDSLMKLIDVMAMYKLNKLHLHLTDDEGWRVEIPGLPELTEVGGNRCHDLTEEKCTIPQLGSSPYTNTSGSGYLSAEDYKAIVSHAADMHIEVIPEIDMPGHARAAIKAMEVRYRKYNNSDPVKANQYRLIDENDTTKYFSVQMFNDNAINPCIESTYNFVEKLVQGLKSIHNNLKIFHFGGDEIAGAWINSTECKKLGEAEPYYNDSKRLTEYFVKRVANITFHHGLDLAGWEDGLLRSDKVPFDREQLPNVNVYGNAWDNVWEWGASRRAYDLANSGYKVVMSQATHLYFDHPYEPDPEERGLYWAPRWTDTRKTFQFMPDDLYANIDFRRSGVPITRQEVCGTSDAKCPPLNRSENIVGMQGHQWSETVLTSDFFDYMVYPRLLALAERAWHKASWEDMSDKAEREAQMMTDWEGFANAVGHRELARLDAMGVKYRVAPPGAIVEEGILTTKTEFPGMEVEYSKDGGKSWSNVPYDWSINNDDVILLRTRSGGRTSRVVTFNPVERIPIPEQSEVDYLSQNIEAAYDVISNLVNDWHNYTQTYTFKNIGARDIVAGNWSIYFYHIRLIQPDDFPYPDGYLYRDCGLRLFHIAGSLYRFQPEVGMFTLKPQKSVVCLVTAKYWQSARTDTMPNWFIAAEGMAGKVMENTMGEGLNFVKPFLRPEQFRRYPSDRYSPYTPSGRFAINDDVTDNGQAGTPVIPTPGELVLGDRTLDVNKDTWVVVTSDDFKNEVNLCADFFQLANSSSTPSSKFIAFEKSQVSVLNNSDTAMESYHLTVDAELESIIIKSNSPQGAFYGLQTLKKLSSTTDQGRRVPEVNVKDQPRFHYRGMHLDVGRNFHTKAEVLKLLDAMALYKLNKFHFHITEDEGWRVEIAGLEELTQVGSKRCYDPGESKCTSSQLGSGPTDHTSGTGFYTIDDYKEILMYANERHIQVIPEVDMPGHCRAGIKAMEERYRRQMKYGNTSSAEEYLLTEPGDKSEYLTVQWFTDNAMNPCMNSTFLFIRHIMEAFIDMHKDIQPLKLFHYGADEVAHGAWEKSEACKKFIADNPNIKSISDLRSYFGNEVGKLAELEHVDIGAWEDGLMDTGNVPYNRSHFPLSPREVYGYAWSNIWEFGNGDRAYKLANAGYKVILSHATHLYFDHPYEPDPEERGYYWATRFTDTRKTFGYIPDDIYANADVSRNGIPLTPEEICPEECLTLKYPENILGIQGQLWGETVRTDEQLGFMIFPRLLALAERAWHKASWEIIPDKDTRKREALKNWISFANNLGYRELRELDNMGIKYRVPVPGARMVDGELHVNSAFPGLKVQYSTDNMRTWKSAMNKPTLKSSATVHLRTLSADRTRHSRVISMSSGISETPLSTASKLSIVTNIYILLLPFLLLIFKF